MKYEPTQKEHFIGKLVGDKYKILALLEQGSVFKSYLAIEEMRNKQYALKVCDKHHNGYSEKLRDRILQEVNCWQKLNHSSIQKVYDVLEDENGIYIVSEYIEGNSLAEVLCKNGPVAQDRVIDWAQQLCEVLGYLHKQNPPYIYGDIKPANIMLQPEGNVKLIDFDVSKVDDVLTSFLSTMGYAAPEGYHGKLSDIYSLGVTLHQLVTGVDPCMPTYMLEPIRAINPNLSFGLERIILKCTQIYPEARYQSCDELLVDLQGGIPYPPAKNILLDILSGRRGFKPKVNLKIKKIYNSVDSEYRDKIFYGSEWSAQEILFGLAKNVFGKINNKNVELSFQIYLQTWNRARGVELSFSTPSYIRQTLCERFSNVDSYIVSKCVMYSLCEIYRHEPELKRRIEKGGLNL